MPPPTPDIEISTTIREGGRDTFDEHARAFNRHGGIGGLSDEIDALRAENQRLTDERDKYHADLHEAEDQIERLRAALERGKTLVEEMDRRMPEQATEDADGWINSYRIPVGPWHRLLGWTRG